MKNITSLPSLFPSFYLQRDMQRKETPVKGFIHNTSIERWRQDVVANKESSFRIETESYFEFEIVIFILHLFRGARIETESYFELEAESYFGLEPAVVALNVTASVC